MPAAEWTIPWKSLLLMERVAAVEPDLLIPVSAPELAKAYLIQPRPDVPRALLSLVTDEVTAPVLVMPVTALTVPEVAQPRRVLLLMLSVAPVAVFLMPTRAAVAPVVEVRVPAFERLPPDRV